MTTPTDPLSDRTSQRPTAPPPSELSFDTSGGEWLDLSAALELGEGEPPATEGDEAEPAPSRGVSWALDEREVAAGVAELQEVRLLRTPTPTGMPPLRRRRFLPPIPREDPE